MKGGAILPSHRSNGVIMQLVVGHSTLGITAHPKQQCFGVPKGQLPYKLAYDVSVFTPSGPGRQRPLFYHSGVLFKVSKEKVDLSLWRW